MDTQEFQRFILQWMERIENRLTNIEQDVSWMKGKLEAVQRHPQRIAPIWHLASVSLWALALSSASSSTR